MREQTSIHFLFTLKQSIMCIIKCFTSKLPLKSKFFTRIYYLLFPFPCACVTIQMYLSDIFVYIGGFVMTVGEKIRTYRKMRGISQKMLGELAGGINEVTIRKYEAGDRNPKLDQLLKIADALGISINILWILTLKRYRMYCP